MPQRFRCPRLRAFQNGREFYWFSMSDSIPDSPLGTANPAISQRFRGFLPVVVDVETGGFNAQTDALLEIAATIVRMDHDGKLYVADTVHAHVNPFEGANMDPESLKVNGIKPDHPLRLAEDEVPAMTKIFKRVREEVKATQCNRAILVGHNAWFDLSFVNAVVARNGMKRNPFHAFSSFDTATMGGLVYGQTVLAKAADAAGMKWDSNEAHSARYDTESTAELFCRMVNAVQAVYESLLLPNDY